MILYSETKRVCRMVVTMKRFIVESGIRVGDAAFGCSREDARKVFGKRFKEIKKTVFLKKYHGCSQCFSCVLHG